MDPLSAAASVAGIIQLSNKLIAFINSAVGASKERKALRERLRACEVILNQLKDESDDAEEGEAWSETIKILEAPGGPLGRLRAILQEMEAKLQPRTGLSKLSTSIAWPFQEKEIKEFQSNIDSEKALLTLALANDSRRLILEITRAASRHEEQLAQLTQAVQHTAVEARQDAVNLMHGISSLSDRQTTLHRDMTNLHLRHDAQDLGVEREAILAWLSPVDYTTEQADCIRQRQPGSCQWFLDSAEFLAWRETQGDVLFCPGIPGAGKTILASIVIENLLNEAKCRDIGVAFVYSNFRRQYEQKAEDILGSLLKQLAQDNKPNLPGFLRSLYARHRESRTRPALDDLSTALRDMCSLYSRVFFVVDALDEISPEAREAVLQALRLVGQAHFNLLVTSRPETSSQFFEILGSCGTKEISASDDDILGYIERRSRMLRRPRLSNFPDLQGAIKHEVMAAAHGMFLLAKLQLDYLFSKRTPGDIRDALHDLPKGLSGLDVLYEQAMTRILSQNEGDRETSIAVLAWITHARRPLDAYEVQHAMAVRSSTQLNPEYMIDTEDLISGCAGLVAIDEGSNVVRLVHYTTQEYFARTKNRWFPDADGTIADTCLKYLSFETFNQPCQSEADLARRLEENPLFDYACRFWADHTLESPPQAARTTRALGLLLDPWRVKASSQVLNELGEIGDWLKNDGRDDGQISGLELAVWFGLHDIVKILLSKGGHQQMKARNGQRLLSIAAFRGHPSLVRLLLDCGASIETSDNKMRTALSWAAYDGQEGVVNLLVERGAYVDPADYLGRTPLSLATYKGQGYLDVVDTLLDHGADMNSQDIYGLTPLARAAQGGYERIVRTLLKRGALVDVADSIKRTPLIHAATRGDSVIFAALLENAVDPDAQDHYGSTALSHAARHGHTAVVKLLLNDERVNVDSADMFGYTPIFYARQNGHNDTAKLLAEAGSRDVLTEQPGYQQPNADTGAFSMLVCDVCGMGIFGETVFYYHCYACNKGNFDICSRCYRLGAGCLDAEHELVAETASGNLPSWASVGFVSSIPRGEPISSSDAPTAYIRDVPVG
ncbi:hypothetical protein QBC47DRAFT_69893 [Echria macrotheca]|uniref:Uncharacterized protein n=1 Tax=Echria macrotheca TaxID=438768 RepID=A0AAJ0F8P6_9PEZI|nr:hypothetical protein QBC47DRAFT_69893 [Echria macrotheca]